jgi:hypothetical protein
MNLYKREYYLNKIRPFYNDTGIIKVITGIRRCGKSCLMQTISQEISETNIPEKNIIYINLDKKQFKNIKTSNQLETLIDSLTQNVKGIKYLFIDEIQNVSNFEEIINAYREEEDYSIFITGSNSYLLSGELITKLTGRYIEFELFTLSFEEYIDMKSFYNKEISSSLNEEFDKYIIEGGFPKALEYDNVEDKRIYLSSIITEIFEKDIRKRVKIKNVSVFNKIQTYIINNFGATISIKNILKELKNDGIIIKRETLNRYIQILTDAKIIYKCNRFDMKSKRSLGSEQKYYLADLSLYFITNTDNRINYGPVLENIIYLYLRTNGYTVSVGKIGKLECDFIIRKNMEYAYIQVAMTILNSKETEDREYSCLEKIKDNYPKYVITKNDLLQHRNGIKHINIVDFIKLKNII